MSPIPAPPNTAPTAVPADCAPPGIPACPMPWPGEPKAYLQLHTTATASLPPHQCKPALWQGHGDATVYLGQGPRRVDMGSVYLEAKALRSLSGLAWFSSAGVAQGTCPVWGTRLLCWRFPNSSLPVHASNWAGWHPWSPCSSAQTIRSWLWIQLLKVFILLTTAAFHKTKVSGSFPSVLCPLWLGDSQALCVPACLLLKSLNLEQGFGAHT